MARSARRPVAAAALSLGCLLCGCGVGSPAAPAPVGPAPASAKAPQGTPSGTAPHATASGTAPRATTPLAGLPATDAVFRAIEDRYGARVGLFLLDTGTGRTVTYRPDRRFAACSTVKVLAAAALLRQEETDLDRTLTYTRADVLAHAPVTSRHVAAGMALRDVMDAALRYSDNTAENLLLRELGGPAGLQRAVRGLGDATTRTDRTEPSLNEAAPGDIRDTSTARALAADLRVLLVGNALPADRRALLTDWMTRNTTGGPYIRAALPAGWTAADKTGSGGYGTRNDIAVLRPPAAAPLVIAVLTSRDHADTSSADALIADTTRAALTALTSP
ncbi:class A beta-lactamase [Streptomyces sp. NRRL F-5123]|uniref:class A beta-lactamase n=1 Tax=Streptomyces sp. NRRL F-5123 TaxID=1463856 RepID=UPI0004E159D0|nr:class A beta-lactamase [Streptomyces sp. NRRL F-5123]